MSDYTIKLRSGRYQCLLVSLVIITVGMAAECFGAGKVPDWALTFALGTVGYYMRGGYAGETK